MVEKKGQNEEDREEQVKKRSKGTYFSRNFLLTLRLLENFLAWAGRSWGDLLSAERAGMGEVDGFGASVGEEDVVARDAEAGGAVGSGVFASGGGAESSAGGAEGREAGKSAEWLSASDGRSASGAVDSGCFWMSSSSMPRATPVIQRRGVRGERASRREKDVGCFPSHEEK
jgi:hypothetical protein